MVDVIFKPLLIYKEFRKYNFYLLGMDELGNVFINPMMQNQPAFFLRVVESKEKVIKNGFIFEEYKGKWYINKHFRKS